MLRNVLTLRIHLFLTYVQFICSSIFYILECLRIRLLLACVRKTRAMDRGIEKFDTLISSSEWNTSASSYYWEEEIKAVFFTKSFSPHDPFHMSLKTPQTAQKYILSARGTQQIITIF